MLEINLPCGGIFNRMVLSILLFSLEMAVNHGLSRSNLVLILYQRLWCNEDFGYSVVVRVEVFEAAGKNRRASKSPALRLTRFYWCVTLILAWDSEMHFSYMDYQGSGNVTRAHQRMKRFFRCPGSGDFVWRCDFSWEWNSPTMPPGL